MRDHTDMKLTIVVEVEVVGTSGDSQREVDWPGWHGCTASLPCLKNNLKPKNARNEKP